jgi:predicted DNA-binding transcriptional regulator YafY
LSNRSRRGGAGLAEKAPPRRSRRAGRAAEADRDTPSFRLARSVLRLYTDPNGVAIAELLGNLGIKERAFRNYQKRFQRVLGEFLPPGATLEARGRGAERRLCVSTPIGATAQWELVARLAAHDLIRQLFGFMGESEVARQLHLAESELLGRIEKNFAAGIRKNFDRMFFVLPDAPKDYSKPESVAAINEIVRAITFGNRLKITYTTPGKAAAEHELEPLTLGLHRSALYLFARYTDGTKVYNFAIDRISKVERLTGNYYKYPTSKEWSPEGHFERTFGVFAPPANKREAIDVDLVFADVPWLKAHISERRWMPGQRIDAMPDGRLRLRFTVNSLIEITPWIAQWGKDVEVRAPRLS